MEWFLDMILYPKRYVEFSSSTLDLFTFWPPWPGSSSQVSGVCQIKDKERLICSLLNCPGTNIIMVFHNNLNSIVFLSGWIWERIPDCPPWSDKEYFRCWNQALLSYIKHKNFLFPWFSDLLRVQTVVLQFCLSHCVFYLFVYLLITIWNVCGRDEGWGLGPGGWGLGVKGIFRVDRNIQLFLVFVLFLFFSPDLSVCHCSLGLSWLQIYSIIMTAV